MRFEYIRQLNRLKKLKRKLNDELKKELEINKDAMKYNSLTLEIDIIEEILYYLKERINEYGK